MCPVDSETPDLGTLIDDWLDWSEAGKALGVSVSKVRQLIREHQLAAAVPSPGAGQQVPAGLGGQAAGPGDGLLRHSGPEPNRAVGPLSRWRWAGLGSVP